MPPLPKLPTSARERLQGDVGREHLFINQKLNIQHPKSPPWRILRD